MDMDSILNSVNAQVSANVEPETATAGNSEPQAAATEETTSSTTSVEKADEPKNGGQASVSPEKPEVTSEPKPVQTTEPAPRKERKVYHRSSSSDLARAQYSAQKWQKKYKALKSKFDEQLEDFNKYKNLDVSQFEDDAQRQQYLAWKASSEQRLQDMSEDMADVRRQYAAERQEQENEVYNDKIESIYGEESDSFRDLDDEWGDAYEIACQQFDPDGVINSFIKNSDVGPAIKNVLYSNDELQHDLFEKSSGNRMIDASERLRILKSVERSVMNFLNAPRVPQAPAARPAVAPTRKLPHLPPRKGVNPVAAATARKPQVTGSLTKTDVGGPADVSSEVSNLYRQIFG